MKLHGLSIVLLCLVSAPALATSHSGGHGPKRVAVLLDSPSHSRSVSLPSVVDLRASEVHARNIAGKAAKWDHEKFARWLTRGNRGHGPKGGNGGNGGKGGGPVVTPGSPPSAMPEPSSALLFGLGTGAVALGLRRRAPQVARIAAR
jgi:hypothetical protein